MAGHSYWRMALIISACLSFLVVCVINGLAGAGNTALFNSTTGNVSDKYYLEITPAGWTFSIWGLIYALQAAFLLYALVTLFIKTPRGYLYKGPAFVGPEVYAVYIVNMAANILWIFMFDQEKLEAALGALVFITVSLYFCLGAAMRGLSRHSSELIKQGRRKHVILDIVLVQNGLGIYAGWVTIASLLNLGMVLSYRTVGLDQHIACSISLGVLSLVILLYAILDHVLFEKQFRYLFSPFIPLIMGLIGSLDKNWDSSNANTVNTVTLLVLGCVLLLVKVARCIYKSITDPLYRSSAAFTPTTHREVASSQIRLT